jgi:hypothetical protein
MILSNSSLHLHAKLRALSYEGKDTTNEEFVSMILSNLRADLDNKLRAV